jgi:hypothetical protein
MKLRHLIVILSVVALTASLCFAQFRGRSRGRGMDPDIKTARAAEQHSVPTPQWHNPPGFEKDVFTFVRIRYGTHNRYRSNGYWIGSGRWTIDFPDADLNISYRLQQLTSMRVDPDGRVLELTDPELFNYPFIYIVEPGDLAFSDEEVPILRRYLLNGGFLMLDDFWGEAEWENMAAEMKKVFPDRDWVDLPRSHPIFHCVFDLPDSLNLQCPNVGTGTSSQYTGVTWERYDAREVHVRAIFDDKGRMMCIATHNTDNGDGWEREGENEYYFREFAEKKAYPLGINIFFYAMTH